MTWPALCRLLLVVCCLSGSAPVWAVQVKGLYQVSVAVADRSEAERKRAINEGFQQVLVRITGDSGVSGQDVGGGAGRLVSQFSYESRNQGEGAEPGIFLKMQFDANGINGLLAGNSLPLWSSDRPRVLLWMVWEQGVDREFVNGRTLPGPYRMLQAEAVRRGIPLRFPELDADDAAKVTTQDVWGMFSEPVLAASARYDAPVVLMVKVEESSDVTKAKAMMQLGGKPYWFELSRNDAGSTMRLLMDQVVDKLGSQYAVLTSRKGSGQVLLQVDDVGELNDFAALTLYMDRFPAISNYQLQRIRGAQVEFLVNLASDQATLEQGFRLDGKLSALDDASLTPVVADIPPTVPAASVAAAVDPSLPAGQTQAVVPSDAGTVATAAAEAPAPGPVVLRYRWRK